MREAHVWASVSGGANRSELHHPLRSNYSTILAVYYIWIVSFHRAVDHYQLMGLRGRKDEYIEGLRKWGMFRVGAATERTRGRDQELKMSNSPGEQTVPEREWQVGSQS